jgi:hypothetical protein
VDRIDIRRGTEALSGIRRNVERAWKDSKEWIAITINNLEAEAVIKLEDDVEQDAHYKQSSQIYKKSKTIMVKVMQIGVDDEGKELLRLIYTDGTGQFPKQSRTGMNYIMVLAENDSDAILVEAVRNRSAGEMVRAYSVLIERLHACGIFPTKQVLDNEISQAYKDAIASFNIAYELVPPHNHERNKAERAIQTFKNHFVSILCGADKDFPLYLWSDILRQAEHTLNLLRPSRRIPAVSAYAYMYGQHNYDQNPFAPLGCKVEAHMMPSTRDTWAEHTASGYYIGSSPEHYRCHVVYITATRSLRVCQTVFFKHKYLTQPSFTTNDALLLAADRLTTAIEGVLPTTTSTQAGVQQLLDIFKSQANGAKNEITAQRVQMADAAAQRVLDESTANEIARAETATQRVLEERMEKEVFQVITDDDHTEEADSSVPMITQEHRMGTHEHEGEDENQEGLFQGMGRGWRSSAQ